MHITAVFEDPVYRAICKRVDGDPNKLLFQDPYHRYLRILTKLHRLGLLSERMKCLDLGCLRPGLASLLIRNFHADVTGVDQWDMLADWQEVPMSFFNLDLSKDWSAIAEERFEVIFALEIIEHMIDTDDFLDKCRSILSCNGILVISTPNVNCLRNRLLVPFGHYPAFMEYKNIIHHVRLYNVPAIIAHLAEHQLDVVKIFGVNFFPYSGPMHNTFYRSLSERMADIFPSLCSNIVVIARARGNAAPANTCQGRAERSA